MASEARDTIQCVHCGGEIKAAAKICKHCTRPVGTLPVEQGATPTPAWTTTGPSPVLVELKSFLMQRGLLRREQVDLVLNANPGVDAGVALGHLAAAGYLTTVQAETLRAAFWQHQGQRAQAVLNAAVQRGLLTPAHVQTAMSQYESVALQRAVSEFLTANQLLTPAQAAELTGVQPSVGNVGGGLRAQWVRLPQVARGLVILGVLAIPMLCVALLMPPENLGWHCRSVGRATSTVSICYQSHDECVSAQRWDDDRMHSHRSGAEQESMCRRQPTAFCHSEHPRGNWTYACWGTSADCATAMVMSATRGERPSDCRELQNTGGMEILPR